jgi:hypothetical protein
MSVVVTETESLMTWSRLEGLLLHWAVSRKAPPAERWELPPRGWKTLPESTVDAGGCERCVVCYGRVVNNCRCCMSVHRGRRWVREMRGVLWARGEQLQVLHGNPSLITPGGASLALHAC